MVEQVSRLTHSSGYAEGLYPAQWTALRFFSEAPASARTTAGLARFQGMSLGPVARTVRTLVDKGLLARAANPLSRRADLIAVTATGRMLLQKDPRLQLAATIDKLPADKKEAFAGALELLLYHLFAIMKPNSHGDEPVPVDMEDGPENGPAEGEEDEKGPELP